MSKKTSATAVSQSDPGTGKPGHADAPVNSSLSASQKIDLYRLMVRIRRFEERSDVKLGLTAKQLDEHLTKLSYAELEEFCTDVLRRLVLQGPKRDAKAVVASRLLQLSTRFQVRK